LVALSAAVALASAVSTATGADALSGEAAYGHELIVRTDRLIGPAAPDPARRYSGNGLTCQSCHLEAGTKPHGLSLAGAAAAYPKFRARSGKVVTLTDRIDECLTRSMNGRPLPPRSREAQAITAYLKTLSRAPRPAASEGGDPLVELARPADPGRGGRIYAQICAACHGVHGRGQHASGGYLTPPLWERRASTTAPAWDG